MKKLLYLALVVLVVVHQDFWWWRTYEPLVGGVIPVGLAWHVGISISAGLLGLLAVKFCWPHELDADDAAPNGEGAAT